MVVSLQYVLKILSVDSITTMSKAERQCKVGGKIKYLNNFVGQDHVSQE